MRTEGYWNVNGHWRYKPTQSEQQLAKVEPIDRVINECRRRADDAWWEGRDEEARIEEAYAKIWEQDKEEGILWATNF
jgi:hypothetical protein